MRKALLIAPRTLPWLLAATILAGCAAGVTPQLMRTDAEITYGQKERQLLVEKRQEFDQLSEDFLLSLNPVFLKKMAIVLELTDKDIDKARVFLGLQQPYYRGIALARWQSADEAVRIGEKQLGEMMLIFSELHYQYGDPAIARATLEILMRRFAEEPFSAYRKKATVLLAELDNSQKKDLAAH